MKTIKQWKIDLENEFKQLKERANQLVAELSVEIFNAKPGLKKWSMGIPWCLLQFETKPFSFLP
ncbi:MAG: hypothetical protein PVH61_02170 [Candidatus Aminicenantes bacterium]|jgi:hypothetical protein